MAKVLAAMVVVLGLVGVAGAETKCSEPKAYNAPGVDGPVIVYVSLCDRVFRSSVEPQAGGDAGDAGASDSGAAASSDSGPGNGEGCSPR